MEAPPLLPQLLISVFDWFDSELLSRMASKGWPQLSRGQSMVMAYVKPTGIRMSDISRKQFVSRQAIHRTVNELCDLGLLALKVDPVNKSAKLVYATKRGLSCIDDAKKIFRELELELGQNIGTDNTETLRAELARAYLAIKSMGT